MTRTQFIRRLFLIAICVLPATANARAADDEKTDSPATMRAALIMAFRTNLDYCKKWIAASNFKSLTRTSGQLPVLAASIARYFPKSQPPKEVGNDATDALNRAVDTLTAAAKADDASRARGAIDDCAGALDRIDRRSASATPQPIAKSPAGFNPLMSLIDGTFSDAKTAASVGDVADAKSYASVMAELGAVLAIDRNDERWKTQSHDLIEAAKEAAASKSEDPKELRAIFHKVYERCEACHAVRRPQGAN